MPAPPPASWFPDPFGRHELRYWDGASWTHHVSSHGHLAVDPPTAVNSPTSPAGWYPDPFGRHDSRYWDGRQWAEQVTTSAPRATAAPASTAAPPPAKKSKKSVERQARKVVSEVDDRTGDGTLVAEPVLVVNQKAKLVGSTVSYVVYDRTGRQLGMVQEVRRDLTTKLSDKLRGLDDSSRTYRLQVVDTNGSVLLAMTRPEVWGLRSSMVVDGPGGSRIGEIVQETTGLLGSASGLAGAGLSVLSGVSRRLDTVAEKLDKVDRVRFGLVAGGHRLGSIHTESGWSWDFDVRDTSGTEVARITKTWAGWAKERFTKADNYVLQMHRPLEEPLRSLVVAAALALDIALKQGDPSRGSSLWGTRRYR